MCITVVRKNNLHLWQTDKIKPFHQKNDPQKKSVFVLNGTRQEHDGMANVLKLTIVKVP